MKWINNWYGNGKGIYRWFEIESDFKFYGYDQSLVSVPASDINEEYVLLIGGKDQQNAPKESSYAFKNVYKFNETWFNFGKLNKPRFSHNAIYWNGAVFVIGGFNGPDCSNLTTKMEIWKIKDSPDQFKTFENWPELNGWSTPHVFIVQDTFFPDY